MKLSTVLKLVILCLIVGWVMQEIGLTPSDISGDIGGWLKRVWNSLLDFLKRAPTYLFYGAFIVIPLFLIHHFFLRKR